MSCPMKVRLPLRKGTGGLEVYALSLRPEANQWNCKVTFSRWEWDKGT